MLLPSRAKLLRERQLSKAVPPITESELPILAKLPIEMELPTEPAHVTLTEEPSRTKLLADAHELTTAGPKEDIPPPILAKEAAEKLLPRVA